VNFNQLVIVIDVEGGIFAYAGQKSAYGLHVLEMLPYYWIKNYPPKAAAPPTISLNSLVMASWRALL